jgi:hypothetical protein
MHARSLITGFLVLTALGGISAVGWYLRPTGPVTLKLVRIEFQTHSTSKEVTVEFSNPGPKWVCFAGDLKFQARAAHRWSDPMKFPDPGDTVLLSRTNRQQVTFSVPYGADACRFLLSYRVGTSPYCQTYFCLEKHGLRSRFPRLSKAVLKCVPRQSRWQRATPELKLPLAEKNVADSYRVPERAVMGRGERWAKPQQPA